MAKGSKPDGQARKRTEGDGRARGAVGSDAPAPADPGRDGGSPDAWKFHPALTGVTASGSDETDVGTDLGSGATDADRARPTLFLRPSAGPATRPAAPPGPAAATAVPASVRAVYDVPTLRPCDEIRPERSEDLTPGLRQAYAALMTDLPLLGGRAMRPTADGGAELGDRLRASLPWMSDAIGVIERQLRLAVWAGRPWLSWRPLLLLGPPGVGKTHLAREIGRLAGVGHAVFDLGGMHDAAALTATSRGWTNAKPCWPAEMMDAHRCANPVLVLDELDKSGGSRRNGDPRKALLAMLEPSTAEAYFDACLMCEVDLSAACWILTANAASGLPRPLLSRLDVVRVGPPGPEHLDGLVADVVAGFARRWGVPAAAFPELPGRARRAIRDAFGRHRSVRLLKRHVEEVLAALVAGPRADPH